MFCMSPPSVGPQRGGAQQPLGTADSIPGTGLPATLRVGSEAPVDWAPVRFGHVGDLPQPLRGLGGLPVRLAICLAPGADDLCQQAQVLLWDERPVAARVLDQQPDWPAAGFL